jgi:hypothetical protein
MEKEGYNVFYSAIPNHKRWKRSDKNPNREVKGDYKIEEVALVPAGQLPEDPFYLKIISRPFSLDMLIRKFTRIENA